MYIPTWLIIIAGTIVFFIYISRKKNIKVHDLGSKNISVEDIEENIKFQKERIFELEHFDSPHFIDAQNAFDAMEINYLRLKQRLLHTPEKVLEIAKDWYRYAEALNELKHARVMLDVDMSDEVFDNLEERSKEPLIIKDEVEKKFKSLLGKDWQQIPPDYFKRMETMKEPDEKTSKKYKLGNDWKYYYRDSANLYKLEEKRQKEHKEEGSTKKES